MRVHGARLSDLPGLRWQLHRVFGGAPSEDEAAPAGHMNDIPERTPGCIWVSKTPLLGV